MSKRKALLLPLSLMLSLSACEMKSNLDDMHKSTVEMEKTTGKVEKHSESIDNQTGELYDALRQGDSLQSRRMALENLIKAKDPLRKLSEAAKYFMAFEFQIWSGIGQDSTDEKRMALATLAAREFLKDLQQFIPEGNLTPRPFAGQILASEDTNLVNCLNALSATMHFMNPKQETLLKQKKDLKPLTIYSMIEESLLAKTEIESGRKRPSDYPGYVSEVLFSDKESVYLIQARYNYLPTLVIGKTTDALYSKITGARMMMANWNLDLSKLNVVQLSELNSFLLGSQNAKKLLEQLGEKPVMDSMLGRMLKNMQTKKSLTAASSDRTQLENDFAKNSEIVKNP
jgi:hypothetical protein